ncbi:MAG: alpha-amylase family glycosyl hydrolase [Actinomycetota bacterium]|nr:alpha-amylase family glycosyl hydrolase [Actinomycetota bacterium]
MNNAQSEPLWWKHGVIYQIYPRSFVDATGDGVGDLAGITSKLDYIQTLGVDAIWLSPFYPSPMADFGYDVSDYTGVDELFGSMADFDELLAEAHQRDLKLIIDWVPNHTSDKHPWFAESRSSRTNAKRDWYVWRDGAPDGGPPNNWQAAFRRAGRAWTFEQTTGQWYLHSFLAEQPDLNWDNPEVEVAMHDTLRFWLDKGVDGFRIDVAHKIGKDPGLADNPADVEEFTALDPRRRHDEDWPSAHERLAAIRRVVDDYPSRLVVGEVYILDLERLMDYVNAPDGLNLSHNFVFLHQPWDADAFGKVLESMEELRSPEAWAAWFLNNHDHSRVATRYGPHAVRAAAMLVLTLRGTPFLFQGEELGLPDAPVSPDQEVDVDGRDPERAPIPWEPRSVAGPGAGFTSGAPWLPITPDAERLNAASQSEDPGSTLAFYRRLIRLRNETPCLHSGSFELLASNNDVLAYVRAEEDQRMVVVLNFSATEACFEGAPAGLHGTAHVALSTDPENDRKDADLRAVPLGPGEGLILEVT